IDGKIANFNYLTEGVSYGLPVFDIDIGSHLIEAKFKNTPIRNIADKTSLVSLIVWICLAIRYAIVKLCK
ncbi:hypothetical protein HYW43_00815, partial [Candidatus Daviesbacteria bacterium]|nr:hypothetical protein [Candidatus Daviesbacteria bacterium]